MTALLAYGCALVAVLFFGSNFVPVKKYETSDGVFFQFVMCLGIFCTGMIVNVLRGTFFVFQIEYGAYNHTTTGFPDFQPVAMIGGFLWCTGNMLSVPIIKLIGLSLGLLIWGTSNMLMGWSSGTFGFFGLKSHTPDNVVLNYCGVCTAVCALALYTQIRATNPEDDSKDEKSVSLLDNTTPTADGDDDEERPKVRSMSDDPELDRMFNHYASNDHASLSSATPRLLGVDPYVTRFCTFETSIIIYSRHSFAHPLTHSVF